jgi:hypothetical protein
MSKALNLLLHLKPFPWWLKGEHKKIAEALINIGFCYSGRAENFCDSDFVCNCKDWRIGTRSGNIFIDAIYDGAVFSRYLATEESFKTDKEYFNKVLEDTKRTIRITAKSYNQERIRYTQLNLW